MYKLNDMQISLTRTEEGDKYLKKNHEEQLISCGKTHLSKGKAFTYVLKSNDFFKKNSY